MEIDINKVTHPELENWLIQFAKAAEDMGLKMADARATMEQLEDAKKVMLYSAMPDEGKVADRERVAYTSQTYQAHLEGLSDARRIYYEAQIRYAAAQAKFEAVRSVLSIRKQEIERRI